MSAEFMVESSAMRAPIEASRPIMGQWPEYFAQRIDQIRTNFPENKSIPEGHQYVFELINEGTRTQDRYGLDDRLFNRVSDLEFYLALCDHRLRLRHLEQRHPYVEIEGKVTRRILGLFAGRYSRANNFENHQSDFDTPFNGGDLDFLGDVRSVGHLRYYHSPEQSLRVKEALQKGNTPLNRAKFDLGFEGPNDEKPFDAWVTGLSKDADAGDISPWDRVTSRSSDTRCAAFVISEGLARPTIFLPTEVASDLYSYGHSQAVRGDFSSQLIRHEFFHTQRRFTLGPEGKLGIPVDEFSACHVGDRGDKFGSYPELKLLFRIIEDLSLGKIKTLIPEALSGRGDGSEIYQAISNYFSFDIAILLSTLFPFVYGETIESLSRQVKVEDSKKRTTLQMNTFLNELYKTACVNTGLDRINAYLRQKSVGDFEYVLNLGRFSGLSIPRSLRQAYWSGVPNITGEYS